MEEQIKDEYYSVNELVVMLKIGRKTVFRYIHSGELKASKIGNKLRIKKSDLEHFIERNQYKSK